ncbi:hypothetical protein RDI58_006948 [Solanum bulbocastanum]|uniref:DUF4283 domain-containing protein n=1 Tax=Solanum bulbocastanum TaxID=147425 RepID=A0AAN8YI45_SOLBU
MDNNDQEVSQHEANLLSRSTKKQKEELISNPILKVSFLESLISDMEEPKINYVTQSLDNISFQDEQKNHQNHPNFIPITSVDKLQLYAPWRLALIIKLVGKKMGYIFLQNKIQTLWQPSEKINLIDLGEEFYLIKLTRPENLQFISVRKWEPKFNPSQSHILSLLFGLDYLNYLPNFTILVNSKKWVTK